MIQRSSIQKKQHKCFVCGFNTSLYRVERVDGEKRYVCSKHPKKERQMKIDGVIEKDNKFYAYIWKTKSHFCEECGRELKEMKKWYMHHILPKAQNPYFRHDERNILMLCYQHHNEIESATSAPKMKVFARTEKIKEKLLDSIGLTYQTKI